MWLRPDFVDSRKLLKINYPEFFQKPGTPFALLLPTEQPGLGIAERMGDADSQGKSDRAVRAF
jgi:hypothetical protein